MVKQRFARIGAALLVLVAVCPPVQTVLQLLLGIETGGSILDTVIGALEMLLVLIAIWFLGLMIFLGIRALFQLRGDWMQSGLSSLDHGIHGLWPRTWAASLGVAAIVSASIAGGAVAPILLAEAAAAGFAVYLAVGGAPPPLEPLNDFEPLPPIIPQPLPDDPTDSVEGESLPVTLQWYFKREPSSLAETPTRFEVVGSASKARYERFVAEDHRIQSPEAYARFVQEGMTPEVSHVGGRLREFSAREGLATVLEINNALAMVQSIPYVLDIEDKNVAEHPRYPIETLVDHRGDCEDTAILCAACLKWLGYDVRLVLIEYAEANECGHMSLAVRATEHLPDALLLTDVKTGMGFYFCEPTMNGATGTPGGISLRLGEFDSRATQGVKSMQLIEV